MWEFDSEVSQIIQRTPQVKSFRFPIRASGVVYQPGQFFFVTIKVQDKEAVHHFSFSSSPTEPGYIEFTKRITGSDYSQALATMRGGEWAHIRGPFGSFVLPESKQKLAFLSGGIGITPLRSMLRYIADKKDHWDIVLVYGNNNIEEIAFHEELDAINIPNTGLRIVHVLSGTNIPSYWVGRTGYINKDIITDVIPDFMERLYYVSGPPKMVLSLEEQLLVINVFRSQIKKDSFTGYD